MSKQRRNITTSSIAYVLLDSFATKKSNFVSRAVALNTGLVLHGIALDYVRRTKYESYTLPKKATY